jgi:ankyrin repeat protein
MRKTVRFIALICSVILWWAPSSSFALDKADEDLIYQANFGTPDKVSAALKAGGNPNAVGADKWPAISLAALRADDHALPIIKLLVEAGGNLNTRDANGETPLMNAITVNDAEMVKYMIEQGADFYATNTSGRNVQEFAKHYGNQQVAGLIAEAIRIDQQRVQEGRSSKRLYRMLDDYIYYTCAGRYIAYNNATNLYTDAEKARTQKQLEEINARVGNAHVELQHNFNMLPRDLTNIATNVQDVLFRQLEDLISNRNRRKYGVGSDSDLDTRCKDVLELWRASYQQYETQEGAAGN